MTLFEYLIKRFENKHKAIIEQYLKIIAKAEAKEFYTYLFTKIWSLSRFMDIPGSVTDKILDNLSYTNKYTK